MHTQTTVRQEADTYRLNGSQIRGDQKIKHFHPTGSKYSLQSIQSGLHANLLILHQQTASIPLQ